LVVDLTCPAVVAHVATLTLRPIDYARPLVEPKQPIMETDPRAFRMRRIDGAIKLACFGKPVNVYGPCARQVVLEAMASDCLDRAWDDERKNCLLDAKDPAAIDACGPAPAPTLPATPDASFPTKALGEDCIGESDCAPATCVAWSTESGERRATCELPCGPKPDYACPPGRRCVHQGGPSEVCLERK